jgi:hypothetical protein
MSDVKIYRKLVKELYNQIIDDCLSTVTQECIKVWQMPDCRCLVIGNGGKSLELYSPYKNCEAKDDLHDAIDAFNDLHCFLADENNIKKIEFFGISQFIHQSLEWAGAVDAD